MARIAVAAVPLVLVPALGIVQGGFHPDAWVWAGALAAWAAALALAVGARARFLRREWPWPALALAFLCWTLLSVVWSVEPSQSLLEARRMVVYAATVLALVVLARRQAAPVLVASTHVAVSGLVLYALGRYLAGPRRYDPVEFYLLAQPLGYANAVGILAAIGLLLSLVPLAEASRTTVRAAAAAAMPPLGLALELTGSDASWLALAVGALAVFLLHPTPSLLVRPVSAVAPGMAVAVWIGRVSQLAEVVPSPRLDATLVGLAALACAALAAGAVVAAGRGASRRGRIRGKTLAVVAAVVLAAGGVLAAAHAGSTEPRSFYYHVAWLEYRAHPLLGSGAGTFGRYWLRLGSPGRFQGALDAHSLYLETLAEVGPVGLLLLCGFLLFPLRRLLARRGIVGVPAAAGATLAFLVHTGLDWDWELPAVVVAALACAAAVALAEQDEATIREEPPLPGWGRVGAVAVALLLGGAAIAGARSTTEPSAARHTSEAPSGASPIHRQEGAKRGRA